MLVPQKKRRGKNFQRGWWEGRFAGAKFAVPVGKPGVEPKGWILVFLNVQPLEGRAANCEGRGRISERQREKLLRRIQ